MDERIIRDLLKNTGSIIKKYDDIALETGGNFNIFDITRIENKEVIVCRLLAELLNPKGRHGQKTAYLKIFLRSCLGIEFSEGELENMRVTKEKSIDGGRLIDIAIEGNGRFIPIEVKIWAGDQGDQCYDYYKYARKYDKNAKIVYLTPFGHKPSEGSRRELTDNNMVLLSFNVHILQWLEKCLALPGTIRKAPIREILIQFISSIKKFTKQSENMPKMDIVKLLSENEENMRNAQCIADTMEACRAEMVKKFFVAFDEKFTKNTTIERVRTIGDFDVHKEISTFISYMFQPDVKSDVSVVFCVESPGWGNLHAGFFMYRHSENRIFHDIDLAMALRKSFGIDEKTKIAAKNWCIYQEFITFEAEVINLRSGKCENFFKLFDPQKFDQIIDAAVEQARAVLSKVKAQGQFGVEI